MAQNLVWTNPLGRLIFLDSGAHGLYNLHARGGDVATKYKWFGTEEFTKFLDTYAAYVKKHADVISVYPNVDVIYNPELTWKSQKYLEQEHGLHPIPVIHHRTPLTWLAKYLEAGYDYIALGGLGQESTVNEYHTWADPAFEMICTPPSHLPSVRVHGFALTAHELMVRYPWWSVDSTTWIKTGAYGGLVVPPLFNGKWRYDVSPFYIKVTAQIGTTNPNNAGILQVYTKSTQDLVRRYVEDKGYCLGESTIDSKTGKEVAVVKGVTNSYLHRCELNAMYYVDLGKAMPPWPWPFSRKGVKRLL